jgi:PKD repeat protein
MKINSAMKNTLLFSAIILFTTSCQKSFDESFLDNEPPVSIFRDSIQRMPPAIVQFTNPTANNYVVFNWGFGDGSFSLIANPVHAYANFGIYSVALIQQNASGLGDTLIKTVNTSILGSSQPLSTTSFNYFVSMGVPVRVKFTNQSLNSNSYTWKFGDGTTSTSNADTLSHIYTSNGTFTVKLISTGPGGVDSSFSVLNLN